MPRGNKTGPMGNGPLTGRRMGNCANTINADFGFGFNSGFSSRNRGIGRGANRGYGRGFGFFNHDTTHGFTDEETIKNEISSLKNRLSFLENILKKGESEIG